MLIRIPGVIIFKLICESFPVCYYNCQIHSFYLSHIFEWLIYWVRVTISSCILLTWLEHNLKHTFIRSLSEAPKINTQEQISPNCLLWFRNSRHQHTFVLESTTKTVRRINFRPRWSNMFPALHAIVTELCTCSRNCSLCNNSLRNLLKNRHWTT